MQPATQSSMLSPFLLDETTSEDEVCRYCQELHPTGLQYKCESCCDVICAQRVIQPDPTGPCIHVIDRFADPYDAACGVAVLMTPIVHDIEMTAIIL